MLAKKQERHGEMWMWLMLRTILKKRDSKRDLGKFTVHQKLLFNGIFGTCYNLHVKLQNF